MGFFVRDNICARRSSNEAKRIMYYGISYKLHIISLLTGRYELS